MEAIPPILEALDFLFLVPMLFQDLKELFSLPKDGFDVSPTQLQLHAEHGHQISM